MEDKSFDKKGERVWAEMLDIQQNEEEADVLVESIAKRLDFSEIFSLPRNNYSSEFWGKVFTLRMPTFSTLEDKAIIEKGFTSLGCENVTLNSNGEFQIAGVREQAVLLLAMKHLYENKAEFKNKYWQFMMDQCPTEGGGKYYHFYSDFDLMEPECRGGNTGWYHCSEILAIPLGYEIGGYGSNSDIVQPLWQAQYDRMQMEQRPRSNKKQTPAPNPHKSKKARRLMFYMNIFAKIKER